MILKPNCEILLTYIPKPLKYTESISGHLFELFDYYLFLRKYTPVKIYIPENNNGIIQKIQKRYNEVIKIEDVIFGGYDLIKCKNIICVDNCNYFLNLYRSKYITNNFYVFACGDAKFNPGSEPKDIILLADSRIYDFSKFNCKAIDYTKCVYPNIRQTLPKSTREFAHITKACKSIDNTLYQELVLKYPNIVIYSDYLYGENITREPIFDFSFSKFIYTPIPRQFDCSNRLVTECAILGIPVEYWISYYDKALEIRRSEPLKYVLNENDKILSILGL